jgi:hypothetical protein
MESPVRLGMKSDGLATILASFHCRYGTIPPSRLPAAVSRLSSRSWVGYSPDWITRRSDAMNTCSNLLPEPAEALTSSPIGQLRRLVVTADDKKVVITGQVSSYYLKQMAQETLRPLVGQRTLLNYVEVRSDL